nr:classical arabinogalactan protein 9-like [Lolium perenne]
MRARWRCHDGVDASSAPPSSSTLPRDASVPSLADATQATSPRPHEVTPALAPPLADATARSTPAHLPAYKKRPNATTSPFQPPPTLTPPSTPLPSCSSSSSSCYCCCPLADAHRGHREGDAQVVTATTPSTLPLSFPSSPSPSTSPNRPLLTSLTRRSTEE